MYSPQSPAQSFDAKHTLSLSLHPPFLLSPTVARHAAADELNESMSVGRRGAKKRKKGDIRKNSLSEFQNKRTRARTLNAS